MGQQQYIPILRQLFMIFFAQKEIADFEQNHYLLQAGCQSTISFDCSDDLLAKNFIETFFCINVVRTDMQIEDETLRFQCKMFFKGKFKNDDVKTFDVADGKINSPLAPQIYDKYITKQ